MKKWILFTLLAGGLVWLLLPHQASAISEEVIHTISSNLQFIHLPHSKPSHLATNQHARHPRVHATNINPAATSTVNTNTLQAGTQTPTTTTAQPPVQTPNTGTVQAPVQTPNTGTVQAPVQTPNTATTNGAVVTTTHDEKITQFLQQEGHKISQDFPYRMNLYEKGQIAKNNAGVRISETAKQLFGNHAGLLFYYQLFNNAMRVPHWHANATEVGSVLSGKMRVTIWQGTGQAKVFTVEKNGTWMIPQAAVHCLENVGQTELTFLVAYNSPYAADRDFATAWAALPNSILEKSLGLNAEEIDTIKKSTVNRLSMFDPSAVAQKTEVASPLSGNFTNVRALFDNQNGSIRRVDQTTNPAMQAMALQQTILKPGTFRVPHWYTGGDDLLFVYKGEAFFTMMDSNGKVYNAMLKPGDLVFIPVGTFHTYVNTAKENLEIYEAFNSAKNLTEITILNGAQHFSAGTLSGATGLSTDSAQKVINNKREDYILPF